MMQSSDVCAAEISTIFALMVRCPLSFEKLPECPFAEYRNGSSLKKKFRIAESFAAGKRRDLLKRHKRCFEARLSSARQATD